MHLGAVAQPPDKIGRLLCRVAHCATMARWNGNNKFSLVSSLFLVLLVRSSGSTLQCFNGSCSTVYQTRPSEGSVSVAVCWVPSDNASCALLSAVSGEAASPSNNVCQAQRHQESEFCIIMNFNFIKY